MGGFLTFRDLSHLSWTSGEVVDTLTDAARLFIFVFSPGQESLLGWSRNSLDVLGVKDFEIARDGNIFLRHTHGDDRYQLLNTLERTFEQRKDLRIVYRWLRPDTEELRWLLCRAEPIDRPEGVVYEGIIGDITEEMQQFGGNPQFGAPLFEALRSWVAVLDADNRVLFTHAPAAFAGFDFGDPGFKAEHAQSGKIFTDAFSDTPGGRLMRDFLSRRPAPAASEQRIASRIEWGDRLIEIETLSATGRLEGGRAVVVARDCTELAKLESEGAQRKRAESFVQLASGIFHNVNNSLQTIMGYAAAMQRHPDNPELIRSSCESITQLVEHSAGLTHQVLAFKDSLMESQVQLDLNVAVMYALNRIQDLLSTGTKVAVSLGTVPRVSANFHGLVEALESLLRLTHAAHGDAAGLSIQTSQVETGPGNSEQVPPGSYCKLAITASISSASAKRLAAHGADPGLSGPRTWESILAALSRCGAAAQRERGGSGSDSIVIYFPISAQPPRAADADAPTPQILIVDDDKLVLETIAAILNDAGYPCACADSRKAAMQIFKRHSSTIRLVLLDALLPTGHGSSVLRQLRRVKPEVHVIGFSGAPAADLQALLDAGASQVLRKPMNPEKLLTIVREALSKQEAA